MKRLSSFSFIAIVIAIVSIQGLSSCTKDADTNPPAQQDTALTTQILSAHPWKILEERGVTGGALLYYLRGGTNNTQDLNNEFITFNANNTGTLTANNGINYAFTWAFANSSNTKLTWTLVNTPATYTITWDNIRYKNGNLNQDQYYTDGNNGKNSHTQQIRMPK